MKKLLQINSVINSGSTGRIAEDIGEVANKMGWKSYIAYGRNDSLSKSNKIDIFDRFGTLAHVFITRFFDLHGYGSKKATINLIKNIEEVQPDIIHLHNIHGYYLNIDLLFKYLKSSNIPVVWTLHDCWPLMGHGAYFNNTIIDSNLEVLTAKKSDYPTCWFYSNPVRNFNKKRNSFSAHKSLVIVPVSKWLESIASNSFLNQYKINRIYNGVDTTIFRPSHSNLKERLGLLGKSIYLGVASVWEERKGFSDYIKLSETLEANEVIVLIGLTKKAISTLPSNIIGLEKTESIDELVYWYSAADIVLNLSYQETFGMTTVEGFSCGTPAIVYNATASPELVTNLTGIVVSKGDVLGVKKAINEIQSKGKEYYSKSCRERAQKFYDKNARYIEYIELYESLIDKD